MSGVRRSDGSTTTRRWCPLEDYRAQETSNFLSKLYQNSGSKLFAALIESHSLSDRDIQDIKSLLEKEED